LGREILKGDDSFILRATSTSYNWYLLDKKSILDAGNAALVSVITASNAVYLFFATIMFG